MKEKIYRAILDITAEKRACGDVLPYVTSSEVSQRVHEGEDDVRAAAAEISGITIVKTEEIECYYE